MFLGNVHNYRFLKHVIQHAPVLLLIYFDGHVVPEAEGGVGLAMTHGREGGDVQTLGLGVAHQPLALEVGVHLDLRN